MKVSYRLRRIADVRATRALLLPGHNPSAVLELCSRLALDSLQVFDVADGFLIRLPKSLDTPLPGAFRLGELGTNLLLPVNAELVPDLLADEADALARNRGLIFLPHGRVLEFAPAEPVKLAALFGLKGLRRNAWQPLQEPPTLASRVNEIVYHRLRDTPDAIIESGGDGIGEEDPRPTDSSLPAKILGTSTMQLGKAFNWLGKSLHLKGLASFGGMLMAGGLALVPRLSEKLMGKQAAGLRELLEEFRKGNIDKALRRALPLGNDGARGAVPHQGSILPNNSIRYSLRNILSGWGPPSLWYTPEDLLRELDREYRRQAAAAIERGDYRRAAFIYGKLLGDFRMAAAALAQGGLHHDAAVLYLKRLQDYLAAAREFEASGEVDEALKLYRQRGEHELAGDLLRRIGEFDLALAEYRHAADLLVQVGYRYFEAGELMLRKAERPDLAANYFASGWGSRPSSEAVACAVRLAQLHAENADACAIMSLIREAEKFFEDPGTEFLAAEFCNGIVRLGDLPAMAEFKETLRDRCLIMLSDKLRQGAIGNRHLATILFGSGAIWEVPLINDAQVAARTTQQSRGSKTAPAHFTTTIIKGVIPVVRSVCQAVDTGELFLGFESGEIACFNPTQGDVHYLKSQAGSVYSLATDPLCTRLVALSSVRGSPIHQLSCYTRLGQWQLVETQLLEYPGDLWLCPTLAGSHDLVAGLYDGSDELRLLRLPRLLPAGSISVKGENPLAGILMTISERVSSKMLPSYCNKPSLHRATCLLFDGREMSYVANVPRVLCGIPAQMIPSSLDVTPLSWLSKGPGHIEVAGIGAEGILSWLDITYEADELVDVTSKSAPGPFKAAALVGSGLIAAVGNEGIFWLRAGSGGIEEQLRQPMSLPDVVACFSDRGSQMITLITSNGSVSRVRRATGHWPTHVVSR